MQNDSVCTKALYVSNHLSIYLDQDILIQEWTTTPLNSACFKEELLNFLGFFKKIKPKGLLWLQENFDLEIPEPLYAWIHTNILEPQYKAGLRKLAFTVPKEQYAHLSIIDSFNEVESVLQPRYFLNKQKAMQYLRDTPRPEEPPETSYAIKRTLEKTKILLEVDHRHLPHAIKHLDRLKGQFNFRIKYKEKFDLLTLRELEVFKAICRGGQNKAIAAELFLSEATVATHRKTIIKKLNLKSPRDWQRYADAFL